MYAVTFWIYLYLDPNVYVNVTKMYDHQIYSNISRLLFG